MTWCKEEQTLLSRQNEDNRRTALYFSLKKLSAFQNRIAITLFMVWTNSNLCIKQSEFKMKLQTYIQRLIDWTCFPYRLALPATFYTVFHSEFDTHVNLLTQIFKRTTNSDSVYCYSRCLCFFLFWFFFKAHWSSPLSWKSTSPWNHFLTRPNSLSVLTSKSFALQNTLALHVFLRNCL